MEYNVYTLIRKKKVFEENSNSLIQIGQNRDMEDEKIYISVNVVITKCLNFYCLLFDLCCALFISMN